jgi:hypothetical protein
VSATGLQAALDVLAAQVAQAQIVPSVPLPSGTPVLTTFAGATAGPALTDGTLTLATIGGYTVAYAWVPQTTGVLPRVLCDERHGMLGRTYTVREDDADENTTTPLESAAFSERYKLRVHKGADAITLRVLFEPTMIEWLTAAPAGFGFELERGLLVVYRAQEVLDDAGLRAFWDAATEVLRRVGEAVAGRSALADFADDPPVPAAMAERLGLVEFAAPPTSRAAVRAFLRVRYRFMLGPILYGLKAGLFLFALMALAGVGPIVLFSGWGFGAIAGLVAVSAITVYIVWFIVRRNTTSEAIMLGEYAFATEYARARDLELMSGAAFTATRGTTGISGRTQIAARGTLPGGARGELALCAVGETLEAATEFEAVVIDVGPGAAQPPAADVPAGGTAALSGNLLVVTSAPARPLTRTPDSLDSLCETAAAVAARVRAG